MYNFQQPSATEMEQRGVNIVVYPQIVSPTNYGPTKSCPLIGFGVVLLLFSIVTIGLGCWAQSFSNDPAFAYAGMACGAFFLLTASFAIYGGTDIAHHKCSIVTCMVFGILGIIAAAISVIINAVAISRYNTECSFCKVDIQVGTSVGGSVKCSTTCYEAYLPVHIGLVVLSLLESLFGLILSCSACCNVCSCCCCYKEPVNGFVLSQPPLPTFMPGVNTAPPYRRLHEENGIA